MLGIPIVLDQIDNAVALEERGLGLKLDKNALNSEVLLDSLERIINNKRYPPFLKQSH